MIYIPGLIPSILDKNPSLQKITPRELFEKNRKEIWETMCTKNNNEMNINDLEALTKLQNSWKEISYMPSNPQIWDTFRNKTSGTTITLKELTEEEKQEDGKIYDYGTDQDIYGIFNGQNKKITKEHLQTCFEQILTEDQQTILKFFSELGVNIKNLFPNTKDIFQISPEEKGIFRENLFYLKSLYQKWLITIEWEFSLPFYRNSDGTIGIMGFNHFMMYDNYHFWSPTLDIKNRRGKWIELQKNDLTNENMHNLITNHVLTTKLKS